MRNKKGFTLIELLIVIAIIGVLASIVLVSMGGARSKARDAVRQADMRQIASAMEMYYGDLDAYLKQADVPAAIGTYMVTVPKDPKSKAVYDWFSNLADDQKFCMYATMENKGTCTTTRYYAASHKGTLEACDVGTWTLSCP
ncbi:MAG: type II secretion system protein [bacterium]|nr:type II secretion system protein [bacterium]